MMNMFILDDQGRYPHTFMPEALNLQETGCRICGEGTGFHHNIMSYEDLHDKIQHLHVQLMGEEERTVNLSDNNYSYSEEHETPAMHEEAHQVTRPANQGPLLE